MPAHTQVCQCSPGIQAEQWHWCSQQMIKAPVCPRFVFWAALFVSFHFIVSRQFSSTTMFVRASSKNVGRRWKQLVQGGLGLRSGPTHIILPGWTNSTGRKRKRGEVRIEGSTRGGLVSPYGRLGGPDARSTEGDLFVICRQNGGSCCRLWASAYSWVRLYRTQPPPQFSTPSLILSHKTTVTHSHIPVHPSPAPDQLGVCSVL